MRTTLIIAVALAAALATVALAAALATVAFAAALVTASPASAQHSRVGAVLDVYGLQVGAGREDQLAAHGAQGTAVTPSSFMG